MNSLALTDFVTQNSLRADKHGRFKFSGTATLRTASRTISEDMVIRLSLHSGDNDQLVLEETGDFAARETPIGFMTKFGNWTCDNATLTVEGMYQGHNYVLTVNA